MPNLFFTWALRTRKLVHFEFLDNSVRFGERPRTIAFAAGYSRNGLHAPSTTMMRATTARPTVVRFRPPPSTARTLPARIRSVQGANGTDGHSRREEWWCYPKRRTEPGATALRASVTPDP